MRCVTWKVTSSMQYSSLTVVLVSSLCSSIGMLVPVGLALRGVVEGVDLMDFVCSLSVSPFSSSFTMSLWLWLN